MATGWQGPDMGRCRRPWVQRWQSCWEPCVIKRYNQLVLFDMKWNKIIPCASVSGKDTFAVLGVVVKVGAAGSVGTFQLAQAGTVDIFQGCKEGLGNCFIF